MGYLRRGRKSYLDRAHGELGRPTKTMHALISVASRIRKSAPGGRKGGRELLPIFAANNMG